MANSAVSITLEFTPNPNTLKFLVNQSFLEKGAANFTDSTQSTASPLAAKLFQVPGVDAVMIGTNFVTITKAATGNWDVLADEVPKTIEAHVQSGAPAVEQSWLEEAAKKVPQGSDTDVEMKIKEVLDNEIRPAVAMDGGDITFGRYEDGVLYLHLQGSCSSCPSSIATLKMGVETRLREVVPQLKEVVQV